MLQRKAIADATAIGFRDCHAVFDALGFDRINAGGITRSSLQVSARWIVDAGFALESIVPDGYGSIPKAERTGCHVDDLPAIVAFKDAVLPIAETSRVGCGRTIRHCRPGSRKVRYNQKHELGRVH